MNKNYSIVVIGSYLLMMTLVLGTTCLSFFVKPVTEDLGFERGAFTFYYSLIFLVGMFTTPLMGKIIQKYSAKPVVLAGSVTCSLAFVLFSQANSLLAFYAIAVLLGLLFNASSILAASISINLWFYKKRGAMLGLVMSSTGVGTALFSFIMPGFIEAYGWRNGYLLLAVCWLGLTLPTGLFLVKGEPSQYGLTAYGADNPDGSTAGREIRGMTYAQAVRSPILYVFMAGMLLNSMVVSNLQHLPSYFTGEGLSIVQLGSLMSTLSVVLIFAKLASGVLSDRIGLKKSYLLFTLAGLVSYGVIIFTSQYVPLLIGVSFMALFNSSLSIMPSLTTIRLFGEKEFSAIWGVVTMPGAFGQFLGTPIWGFVYDYSGSYRPAFLATPFLLIAAYLMAIYCLHKQQS